MCEIPANILLADQFARRFDGFSISLNPDSVLEVKQKVAAAEQEMDSQKT